MAVDTIRTILNNLINGKLLHLQTCQQGLQTILAQAPNQAAD